MAKILHTGIHLAPIRNDGKGLLDAHNDGECGPDCTYCKTENEEYNAEWRRRQDEARRDEEARDLMEANERLSDYE